MEVMVVNGKRYLFNTDLEPHVVDRACEDILKHYSPDVSVHFEKPTMEDIMPKKPY